MALLPESWKKPRRIGSTGDGDDGPSGEQPPHAPAAASLFVLLYWLLLVSFVAQQLALRSAFSIPFRFVRGQVK